MYSSCSSSLSLSFPSSHDVFPSFHGKDVRQSFLSHVLKEFSRKRINFFIDNEIERGKFIGPELKRAIRGSKIVVVLLSKNYASSFWCLDELVEIMKKELGQTVITIFYEVDPTDVKKQKGDFGKVFKKTCKGKGKEKIKTWRKALEGVATIADLDEARMIGIWGPSGIGKTTIARFLFNQFSSRFQNSALMDDIKGSYPKPCFDEYNAKLQLQNKMLSKMINQKDITIPHLGVAQERLRDRKVFLVLDDVNRLAQLDALAGNVQWFGPGSRIIITTEDLRLLKAIGINHIYKVNFPSTDEALQMFWMYAFHQKSPKDGFDVLAREITYLVGELPLGLKVMGSHFRGLSKEQWSMEVSRLRTNLNGDIESVLKFSYDALCDEDKDLFLHIAFFHDGQDTRTVEEFLGKRFKNLSQRLYVLEEKSLIPVGHYSDYYQYIEMHNLLAQLGKEIVRKEYVREPGKRQIFIDFKDSCQLLTSYTTITGSVVGIDSKSVFEKAFEAISKIQLLPFTNNLEFLVEIRMPYIKLEKLWNRTKRMNLSYSINLKELPSLSTATNLKKLVLEGCSTLVELPSTIGNATNLEELYLNDCSGLLKLPSSIMNSSHHCNLYIYGCSILVELPSSIGNLTFLTKLYLGECSNLVELPSSIGNLTFLTELNLRECSSLVELPSSIWNLTNLRKLVLKGCSSLVSLPQLPDSLLILDAENCESLEKLDCSFYNPHIWFNFINCFNLNKESRDLIIQTSTLKCVVLPGKEVHGFFTYRASGSSVTVKLNQKPLPTSTKFKACILVVNKGENEASKFGHNGDMMSVSCSITSKQNGLTARRSYNHDLYPIITEHLYIFDFEAEEVTSTELVFTFELRLLGNLTTWEIKECGIFSTLGMLMKL